MGAAESISFSLCLLMKPALTFMNRSAYFTPSASPPTPTIPLDGGGGAAAAVAAAQLQLWGEEGGSQIPLACWWRSGGSLQMDALGEREAVGEGKSERFFSTPQFHLGLLLPQFTGNFDVVEALFVKKKREIWCMPSV